MNAVTSVLDATSTQILLYAIAQSQAKSEIVRVTVPVDRWEDALKDIAIYLEEEYGWFVEYNHLGEDAYDVWGVSEYLMSTGDTTSVDWRLTLILSGF